MTQELSVQCPTCKLQFAAELPSDWTGEDLTRHTDGIFNPGHPENCRFHPRSVGETLELPLNRLLLCGELEDPGDPADPRDIKLPVYKPRNRPMEGRGMLVEGYHRKNGPSRSMGDPYIPGCPLTKTELSILALANQGKTVKEIALVRGRAESTVAGQLTTLRDRLIDPVSGVPLTTQQVLEMSHVRAWLEEHKRRQ